jgi:hypothetical protein
MAAVTKHFERFRWDALREKPRKASRGTAVRAAASAGEFSLGSFAAPWSPVGQPFADRAEIVRVEHTHRRPTDFARHEDLTKLDGPAASPVPKAPAREGIAVFLR